MAAAALERERDEGALRESEETLADLDQTRSESDQQDAEDDQASSDLDQECRIAISTRPTATRRAADWQQAHARVSATVGQAYDHSRRDRDAGTAEPGGAPPVPGARRRGR
ncbi:hypothetical protein BDZ31_004696 [Conexibacter arvalis]|uniref:Uncharacterized protein n=1 Tax=Conexibacter arvalis TaxID=912552 RepID=A0A840IJ03_9ACTN|nr:hypothetical protein [Conexibacter arvalis]